MFHTGNKGCLVHPNQMPRGHDKVSVFEDSELKTDCTCMLSSKKTFRLEDE